MDGCNGGAVFMSSCFVASSHNPLGLPRILWTKLVTASYKISPFTMINLPPHLHLVTSPILPPSIPLLIVQLATVI
ncbi:hypothetical protein Hanom_Chr00s000001g01592791 [Helianthus anomalus]